MDSPLSYDEARLGRAIAGGLRETIVAHGPITKHWIGSAAKRIQGQVRTVLVETGAAPASDDGREALGDDILAPTVDMGNCIHAAREFGDEVGELTRVEIEGEDNARVLLTGEEAIRFGHRLIAIGSALVAAPSPPRDEWDGLLKCTRCYGTGEIESSDSTDDCIYTCRSCDGKGKREPDARERELIDLGRSLAAPSPPLVPTDDGERPPGHPRACGCVDCVDYRKRDAEILNGAIETVKAAGLLVVKAHEYPLPTDATAPAPPVPEGERPQPTDVEIAARGLYEEERAWIDRNVPIQGAWDYLTDLSTVELIQIARAAIRSALHAPSEGDAEDERPGMSPEGRYSKRRHREQIADKLGDALGVTISDDLDGIEGGVDLLVRHAEKLFARLVSSAPRGTVESAAPVVDRDERWNRTAMSAKTHEGYTIVVNGDGLRITHPGKNGDRGIDATIVLDDAYREELINLLQPSKGKCPDELGAAVEKAADEAFDAQEYEQADLLREVVGRMDRAARGQAINERIARNNGSSGGFIPSDRQWKQAEEELVSEGVIKPAAPPVPQSNYAKLMHIVASQLEDGELTPSQAAQMLRDGANGGMS